MLQYNHWLTISILRRIHGLRAVYCLHLIGINSTIVGRISEEFLNTQARDALLSIVGIEELTSEVVSLLARDPWESDLPTLRKTLREGSSNLNLINALFQYEKQGFNFREDIPEDADSISVFLKDSTGHILIGKLVTVYDESKEQNRRKGNRINRRGDVIVQSGSQRRVMRKFIADPQAFQLLQSHFGCQEERFHISKCTELNDLIEDLIRLSKDKLCALCYGDFDDRYFHFVDQNGITICTADQARIRWLEYFDGK